MSRLVIVCSEVKRKRAVAKASLNRAIELQAIDAKRDDLPLARMKSREIEMEVRTGVG